MAISTLIPKQCSDIYLASWVAVGEQASVKLFLHRRAGVPVEPRLESPSNSFVQVRAQGQCSTLFLDCEKSLRTMESAARQEARLYQVVTDVCWYIGQVRSLATRLEMCCSNGIGELCGSTSYTSICISALLPTVLIVCCCCSFLFCLVVRFQT